MRLVRGRSTPAILAILSFSLLCSRGSVRVHVRLGSPFRLANREQRTQKHELALPLLVFGVGTNHAHDAASAHDLALVTNPLDRSSYLHSFFTTRPRVRSRGVSSTTTRSPTSS